MSAQEFCYWLQGFFEVTDATHVNEKQAAIIKEHLALVFKKVTGPVAAKSLLDQTYQEAAAKGICGTSMC